MRRRRDEELYGAFDEQEDELSLEAILAEYGKGGRQPALEEPSEGPPSQPEPVPEPEPIPEPEPVQKEERVPGPEYESPAPDRVALKDIMSQTVDAVLEDEDDGVIAQPVPLRERLAAVLERFHRPAAEQRRRPAFQDTEQLFDEPEEEPEPEEPPEPEPLPEDVLRDAKRQCGRLRRGLLAGAGAGRRRRIAGAGKAALRMAGRVAAAVRRPGSGAAADGAGLYAGVEAGCVVAA